MNDVTMKIGHCDIWAGTSKNTGPKNLSITGDVMKISGTTNPPDLGGDPLALEKARAFVQQWTGMTEAGIEPEPISIRDSGAFGVDGIWTPMTTTATFGTETEGQGVVTYSGQFKRIAGGNAAPAFSIVQTVLMRPNIFPVGGLPPDFDIADADAAHPVYLPLTGYVGVLEATNTIISTASGALRRTLPIPMDQLSLVDKIVTYRPDSDAYYNGASIVEFDIDGNGNWETIVGRQLPPNSDITRVRLNNGRVRCYWGTSGAGRNRLFIQRRNDAAPAGDESESHWGDAHEMELPAFRTTSPVTPSDPGNMNIVRNRITRCEVELGITTTAGSNDRAYSLGMSLARGCEYVEFSLVGLHPSYPNPSPVVLEYFGPLATTLEDIDGVTYPSQARTVATQASNGAYAVQFMANDSPGIAGSSYFIDNLNIGTTSFNFAVGVSEKDNDMVSEYYSLFAADEVVDS